MEKYDLHANPIAWRSSDNGDVKVAMGKTSINACLGDPSLRTFAGDILLFNPRRSILTLCLGDASYVLAEVGAFLTPWHSSLDVDQARIDDSVDAANSVALFATAPDWWRPYSGPTLNESGFEGDRFVGVYRLSKRSDPETGIATNWTNDSVSSRPDSVGGVLGLSHVVSKASAQMDRCDAMISILENRPEESVHRHPQVSKYEPAETMQGLIELYIVLSGNLGIALFEAGGNSLTYHLLEPGDALRIDPEEIHAVLATSRDFEYLCVQTPSCYHYPFNYNKHLFFDVFELSAKLGYEIAEFLKIEKPGEYKIDAPANRSSDAERLFL